MQFDSLQALIEMGGHGRFVWMAYGITFAVAIGLIASPMIKRRRLLKMLKTQQVLESE